MFTKHLELQIEKKNKLLMKAVLSDPTPIL